MWLEELLILNCFLLQMECELFTTFIHIQSTHFMVLKCVISAYYSAPNVAG